MSFIVIFIGFCQCKRENFICHRRGLLAFQCTSIKIILLRIVNYISCCKIQVRETFGIGKNKSSESTGTSSANGSDTIDGKKASFGDQTSQQSGPNDSAETLFGKFKSTISSSNFSSAFQRVKDAKLIDIAKKGYTMVKDELSGSPKKRKHLQYDPSTLPQGERSTRTDIVSVPIKQSRRQKAWEAIKHKVRSLLQMYVNLLRR